MHDPRKEEKMDEKINYIRDTIKDHPYPENLAWGIKEVKVLLSYIEELENNIHDPEWCCWEHKKRLIEKIKELEKEADRKEKVFMKIVEQKSNQDVELLKVEDRVKELEKGIEDARKSRTLSEAMVKLGKLVKKKKE